MCTTLKTINKILLVLLITCSAFLYCDNASAGEVYGKIMGNYGNATTFIIKDNDGREVNTFTITKHNRYKVYLKAGRYTVVTPNGKFTAQLRSYPDSYKLDLYFSDK